MIRAKEIYFADTKTLKGFDMGIMLDSKIIIREAKSIGSEFATFEEYMLIWNFGMFDWSFATTSTDLWSWSYYDLVLIDCILNGFRDADRKRKKLQKKLKKTAFK